MRLPPSPLLLQPLRFRGHPADLPAGRSVISDGRRLADVLVRSASVGMVDGIHRDPADLEVGLAERSEGEPLLAGAREGLVPAACACDRADRRAAVRMEGSELARRQLHDGPISLAHDHGLRAGGADEALARKILSHQNTPIRIPISSAENSGLSLMTACLPSRRTKVLTFATLTWNSSSKALLTSVLVARRTTRNSRRFPSFRF